MIDVELPAAWRARAEELRPFAPAAAEAFARAADELEAALRERANEVLNMREAARESGYHEDHLARLVKAGKIPNAGKRGAPKIRRGELPRKPGGRPTLTLEEARRQAGLSKDRRLT